MFQSLRFSGPHRPIKNDHRCANHVTRPTGQTVPSLFNPPDHQVGRSYQQLEFIKGLLVQTISLFRRDKG